jgi:hypothetical protein
MRTQSWLAACALLVATTGLAATIDVVPGPGTPVQDAIDAAAESDTVRLAEGEYPEAVVIAKRLRLRGTGNARLVGDGATPTTVAIVASGVTVEKLSVVGEAATISFQGPGRVRLQRLYVSCGGNLYSPSGTAISVAGAPGSDDVQIKRVEQGHDCQIMIAAEGFEPGDRVLIDRNSNVTASEAAIRVIDSAGAKTRILGNRVQSGNAFSPPASSTAIDLVNSAGARIQRNTLSVSGAPGLGAGIRVDATSNGNLVVRNSVQGYANDLLDLGTSNCWRANFFTSGTDPGCN